MATEEEPAVVAQEASNTTTSLAIVPEDKPTTTVPLGNTHGDGSGFTAFHRMCVPKCSLVLSMFLMGTQGPFNDLEL